MLRIKIENRWNGTNSWDNRWDQRREPSRTLYSTLRQLGNHNLTNCKGWVNRIGYTVTGVFSLQYPRPQLTADDLSPIIHYQTLEMQGEVTVQVLTGTHKRLEFCELILWIINVIVSVLLASIRESGLKYTYIRTTILGCSHNCELWDYWHLNYSLSCGVVYARNLDCGLSLGPSHSHTYWVC